VDDEVLAGPILTSREDELCELRDGLVAVILSK